MTEQEERRSRRPSKSELRAHLWLKFFGTPLNNLTRYGMFAIIVLLGGTPAADSIHSISIAGAYAIAALAGKNTNAKFGVNADINTHQNDGEAEKLDALEIKEYTEKPDNELTNCEDAISLYLVAGSIILAFGGLFEARRQASLRADVIEEKSNRIQELEKMIDPKRTSAKLNGRGGTDKELL